MAMRIRYYRLSTWCVFYGRHYVPEHVHLQFPREKPQSSSQPPMHECLFSEMEPIGNSALAVPHGNWACPPCQCIYIPACGKRPIEFITTIPYWAHWGPLPEYRSCNIRVVRPSFPAKFPVASFPMVLCHVRLFPRADQSATTIGAAILIGVVQLVCGFSSS